MTASSSERIPIRDLISQGFTNVAQAFLVTESSVAEAKNGKPFVRMRLVDRTGEMPAICFDCADAPEPGVVFVDAAIEEFNGAPQAKVSSFESLPDEDPSGYLPSSNMSREELDRELQCLLDAIGGEYGDVVRSIFSDDAVRRDFLETPAALRNHHAYERGLAEHTVSMAYVARGVAEHYRGFYNDPVDQDLVLAGVLLHDLAKIDEYEREGLAWKVSVDGELVGHIPTVATLIHDACMACLVSDDTRRRLLHVVLSHHGQLEWGSPVKPKLIEAQIVHQVDMIDSRMAMMREALNGLEHGEVSNWVRPLGGRAVR